MSAGCLSLLLHAHLPFIRHVDDNNPHRDDWYLEALVECYLPLLQSWVRMTEEKIPFRLTFSISPTLLHMMQDDFLRKRALHHLYNMVELADKELVRAKDWPDVRAVAEMYRERLCAARDFYQKWDANIVDCIRHLRQAGRLEVLTTAATHGFLPVLKSNANAVRAQLLIGLDSFTEVFGDRPPGMWLPECGYYPGVENDLEREGIRYFIVDAQALLKARPQPRYGLHAPVYCHNGVAAFARDPECSEQVWSSMMGYPGDFDYREYYRDIGWELPLEYLAPYLPADGTRKDTGFKYHRITGKSEYKEIYRREWALSKAGAQSQHFVDCRRQQIEWLAGQSDRKPFLLAPFDAELFGHWWFEGPEWLEYVIRKIIFDQKTVELATPADYLDSYPTNEAVELCPSTWGRNSTNEVWVNGKNDYIYRHLHWAAARMRELAAESLPRHTFRQRAIRQAARELLLAQSSDWPFMIADPNTEQYGHTRFREHMLNFLGLYRQLRNNEIDAEWLKRLEHQDNIFADINLDYFR